MTLAGKTILITGATAGIGKATAELLAQQGARLVLTGRRKTLLRALAESLGVPCHTLAFDIRDREAMKAALDSLPPEFASIDILINNAGLALGLEPADKADFSDWETMIETNILGLIAMTRHILPAMRARGVGHIVNLSSIAGTYPYAGGNVYGATKAFVTQFSLNLRMDLLGSPVRVTNIEPGMADTEFSDVRFKGDTTEAAKVYANVEPLHAHDIAEAIRWALTQPSHVNINRIELMCIMQMAGGYNVARNV